MATIDLRVGSGSDYPALNSGRLTKLSYTLDTADQNVGSGDVVHLFNIPANTFIQLVNVNVETLEGGTATVDIGDYTAASPPVAIDADGFHNNLDLNNATGWVSSDQNSAAYQYGDYSAVARVIGLLANNALDAAKITVDVWMIG